MTGLARARPVSFWLPVRAATAGYGPVRCAPAAPTGRLCAALQLHRRVFRQAPGCQFQRPASAITAGTIRARIRVACTNTATHRPTRWQRPACRRRPARLLQLRRQRPQRDRQRRAPAGGDRDAPGFACPPLALTTDGALQHGRAAGKGHSTAAPGAGGDRDAFPCKRLDSLRPPRRTLRTEYFILMTWQGDG